MNILDLKFTRDTDCQQGATLMEVLLYVAVSSVVLTAVSTFYGTLLQSQVKNQTILSVEQQGVFALDTISQQVRNAEAVNTPTRGSESDSLSLSMSESSRDPTEFFINKDKLQMRISNTDLLPLTNSRVRVTDASFRNLSGDGTPDTVRIQLTISHENPAGRNTYDFTKKFYTSATVRQP